MLIITIWGDSNYGQIDSAIVFWRNSFCCANFRGENCANAFLCAWNLLVAIIICYLKHQFRQFQAFYEIWRIAIHPEFEQQISQRSECNHKNWKWITATIEKIRKFCLSSISNWNVNEKVSEILWFYNSLKWSIQSNDIQPQMVKIINEWRKIDNALETIESIACISQQAWHSILVLVYSVECLTNIHTRFRVMTQSSWLAARSK